MGHYGWGRGCGRDTAVFSPCGVPREGIGLAGRGGGGGRAGRRVPYAAQGEAHAGDETVDSRLGAGVRGARAGGTEA